MVFAFGGFGEQDISIAGVGIMKIAAIQLDAMFANVKANLTQSELYIEQAACAGAELVLLPEFFTSAIGFSQQMLDVPRQNEKVHEILTQWALQYNVILGGSYIQYDGKNAFNLFELVFPNGDTFAHKKDIPTQFENCYYTNGDYNHVLVTPIGNFGVALCWEMIRYDTLKRIANHADVILSGSCWWDLPEDSSSEREPLRCYNRKLALDTPAVFAKLSCTPIVHASHCGKIAAYRFPDMDKTQIRQLVGATQIVNETGKVLAIRPFNEGPGFVLSDIPFHCTDKKQSSEFPQKFWIPDLPDSYLNAWKTLNLQGKHYYETVALPYYKSQEN